MIRALLMVVALTLALPSIAAASSMQERFQQANGHYYKKRYKAALSGYQDLLERYRLRDPVLYYNLGNSHFQLEQMGHAVLNFKRALAMSPGEDLTRRIKDNLDRTTEALLDRHRKDVSRSVTVLDETHGVVYSLFHLLSAGQAAAAFLLFWLLFFTTLIGRHFAGSDELRRGLRNGAIALAVPLLLAGTLLAGNLITSETVVRGVVVENNVQLKDGRHPDAPVSDVPEGLEVRIIDSTDPKETLVRLSNGKEGWVPAAVVKPI